MRFVPQSVAAALALMLLAISLSTNALSQERKAYRYVDATGNVTYSQTPPVDGKAAKPVDIAPAQRGRGGSTSGYSPYDDPRHYSNPYPYAYNANTSAQSSQAQREQRLAAVKAECLRQRGTDCNNPATLQYLDSTSIPRRGRY